MSEIQKAQNLKNEAISQILKAENLKELEEIRITYLGRRGRLSRLIRKIPSLDEDEKIQAGQIINAAKNAVEKALERTAKSLRLQKDQKAQWLDVTQPGLRPSPGHLNPVTQTIWEITEAFEQLGYQIMEGPEIETDYYNFEVLNIPQHHPARDLQDTFWLKNGLVPRTHTSAMQVRAMKKLKPPFKVAVPGWVYRSEKEDATHAAVFYQYEGFAVGQNISFADLKGTLYAFLQKVLGPQTQLKFRASYFPYVEPCAEISASCPHCQGQGCPSCGHSGWLELLGAGMIHPVVLKNAGIDPEKYSGFAFGPGPTRIAMVKYKIKDIRLFTGGDLRFINQF